MKLPGLGANVEFTPFIVSGNLSVMGGSLVQFYDGVSYTPNREGTISSPILLTHSVTAVDADSNNIVDLVYETFFYENNVPITSENVSYELLGNSLKVKKNIAPGQSIEIKAISKFIDKRNDKIYEREDIVILRTILKNEADYGLKLSQRGRVYFDGYRNPNVISEVSLRFTQGTELIQNLISNGYEIKWLNSEGLDIETNELYVDTIPAGKETISVDKKYINHETIRCEVWKDEAMLAHDSVTFIRKFNSIEIEVISPQIPIRPEIQQITCQLLIRDMIGNINVDEAFLVNWYVEESGVLRKIGEGSSISVPRSGFNLKAINLKIYPDIKRREAFAAYTIPNAGIQVLATDKDGNVYTGETFGK